MTVYHWPPAKVWLISGGSRFEREQLLNEQFPGQTVYVGAFIESMLEAITQGQRLPQWRERYIFPSLLAFTEAHLINGKEATAEELCQVLWERYHQGTSTVLTAEGVPGCLGRLFGVPTENSVVPIQMT